MELWHDLVFEYNDCGPGKYRAKDHGTFSGRSTVILLMHLSYGPDYPTNIAKFFLELRDSRHLEKDTRDIFKKLPDLGTNTHERLLNENLEKDIPNALKYPAKISSILKRMNDDNLVVLLKKVSVGAGKRSYYALNPKIIQSPTIDDIYYKSPNGLPAIPLEIIEDFLNWMDMSQKGKIDKNQEEEQRKKRHKRSNHVLNALIDYDTNYFMFLYLLECRARYWEIFTKREEGKEALSAHIHKYLHEFGGDYINDETWPKCIIFPGDADRDY
jgi:hypothetical protein